MSEYILSVECLVIDNLIFKCLIRVLTKLKII